MADRPRPTGAPRSRSSTAHPLSHVNTGCGAAPRRGRVKRATSGEPLLSRCVHLHTTVHRRHTPSNGATRSHGGDHVHAPAFPWLHEVYPWHCCTPVCGRILPGHLWWHGHPTLLAHTAARQDHARLRPRVM